MDRERMSLDFVSVLYIDVVVRPVSCFPKFPLKRHQNKEISAQPYVTPSAFLQSVWHFNKDSANLDVDSFK